MNRVILSQGLFHNAALLYPPLLLSFLFFLAKNILFLQLFSSTTTTQTNHQQQHPMPTLTTTTTTTTTTFSHHMRLPFLAFIFFSSFWIISSDGGIVVDQTTADNLQQIEHITTKKEHSALIVVDVQHCFMTIGEHVGSLSVPNATQIIPGKQEIRFSQSSIHPHADHSYPWLTFYPFSVINSLREQYENKLFDLIIWTQDWHCPDHVSFASAHENQQPFQPIELVYNNRGK